MSVDQSAAEQSGGDPGSKPKKPFLRRGEGVDKRLNAWKLRGRVLPRPSSAKQTQRGGQSPAKQSAPAAKWCGRGSAASPRAPRNQAWATPRSNFSEDNSTPARPPVANSPALPTHAARRHEVPAQPFVGWGENEVSAQPAHSPFAAFSPQNMQRGSPQQYQQHTSPKRYQRASPPLPNASDFSMELNCDSTLVGIQQQRMQQQRMDLHARTISASAGEGKSPAEVLLAPAWSERLDGMVSTVDAFGFEGGFDAGQRARGRLERGHSLRDTTTLNEKQAEEALELEEFEALERRVRHELGEYSVDNEQRNDAEAEAEDAQSSRQTSSNTFREGRFNWQQWQEETDNEGIGEGGRWEDYQQQQQGGIINKNRLPVAPLGQDEDEWGAVDVEPARPPTEPRQPRHTGYQSRDNPMWAASPAGGQLGQGGFDDSDTWDEDTAEEEAIAAAAGRADSHHMPATASQGQQQQQQASRQRLVHDSSRHCAAVQPPQASALVQSLFHSRNNELKGEVEDTRAARAREEAERQQAEKLAALEEEIKKFQSERSELGRLKNELQVAAARLESERASFERQKATDLATLQEQRDEAARLQKREKSVLEKQRKALLKMPTKKDRAEIEALEETLEKEKKDARAREARHKLTVERLRRQMVELQQRNAELREEVQWHERQRLEQSEVGAGSARHTEAEAVMNAATVVKTEYKSGALEATDEARHDRKENVNPNTYDIPHAGRCVSSTKPWTPTRLSAGGRYDAPVHLEDSREYSEDFCSDAEENQQDRLSRHHQRSQSRPHSDVRPDSNDALRKSVGKAGVPAASHASELVYYDPSSDMYRAVAVDAGVDASRSSSRASGSRVQYDESSFDNSRSSAAALDPNRHAYDSYASRVAVEQEQQQRQPSASLPRFEVPNYHLTHSSFAESKGCVSGRFTSEEVCSASAEQNSADVQSTAQQSQPDLRAFEPLRFSTVPHSRQSNSAVAPPPSGGEKQAAHSNSFPSDFFPGGATQQAQPPAANFRRGEPQETLSWSRNSGEVTPAGHVIRHSYQDHSTTAERSRPHSDGSSAAQVQQQHGLSPAADAYSYAAHFQSQAAVGRQGESHDSLRSSIRHQEPGRAAYQATEGRQGVAQHSIWSSQQHAVLDSSYDSVAGGYAAGSMQRPTSTFRAQMSTSASQHSSWNGTEPSSLDASRQSAGASRVNAQYHSHVKPSPIQDAMIHEVHHPDGKLERMHASGKRSVLFTNGTYKEQLPSGVAIICFTNQDIKRSYPDGRVEYYYSEVDTWHTTHVTGIEVFYFPNGQTEAHQPNGIKQIMFPDRTVRQVQPDGSEMEISAPMLLPVLKLPVPAKPEQPPIVA